MSINLCDRIGAKFEVAVKHENGLLYFFQGWNVLRPYYKPDYGVWIQLTYLDDSTF